jgi:hypothetical protein
VVRIETDLRVQTTIIPRAPHFLAPVLVLAARAVVVAVAARVHGQAHRERTGTAVVGFWAGSVSAKCLFREITLSVKVNHHRKVHGDVFEIRSERTVRCIRFVKILIRVIETVEN